MTPDLSLPPVDVAVWAISLVLLAPLLAAVAALILPRSAAAIGLAGTLLSAAGVAWLVGILVASGTASVSFGGWAPPLGLVLQADGLSALMLAMTAGVGLAVAVYVAAHRMADAFWPLWLLMLAGMAALYLSRDVFNLYVTLEVVGLAAVGMTALPGTPAALRAALGYLLAGLLGSLLFLLGVGYAYAAHGRVDLAGMAATGDGAAATLALLLMLVGLGVKAALFPLHFWMPSAHASAAGPASALLSGLVVKVALYLVLRLWLELAGPDMAPVGLLIGVMGAVAVVWGSWQAMRAERLKLLVAWSTVAQIGLMALAFAMAGPDGSAAVWRGLAILIVAHAVAKAAMFLSVARITEQLGHDRISSLNRADLRPGPAEFAFALASVSLIGLPPSAGFIGKWLLLEGMLVAGAWTLAAAVIVSTLLSAAYLSRVVSRCLRGGPHIRPGSRRPEWRVGDVVALGLATASLLLGLAAAWPLALLDVGDALPPLS